MTIAQLIKKRLKKTGQAQRAAAVDLGVTRQTLINWMHGAYVPEPWPSEQVKKLAGWLDEPYPRVLALIFAEKGIDLEPDVFHDLADLAKSPVSVIGPAAYGGHLLAA